MVSWAREKHFLKLNCNAKNVFVLHTLLNFNGVDVVTNIER